MAPGGVIAHWRSRPALEPIRAESPSNGAADELVTVASTFWDFGSLSLKTLRRPLCQLVVWQRQSVIVLTLRDALQ